MSPNSQLGTIHATSAKEKHRLRELPEPHGLACKACRKKRHRCDRRKPSCTTCSRVKIECVYLSRKPRVTDAELEDVLRKLERKYNSCLKAKAERAQKTKPGPPTMTSEETNFLTDRPVSGSSELDNLLHYYTSMLNTPQVEVRYGGYHFSEAFLGASSPESKTFQAIDNPPSARSLKRSIPQPTCIFSYVPRYPPVPLICQPDLQATSLGIEPSPPEDGMSKAQSTTPALHLLDNPAFPLPSTWNQCQPDVLSSQRFPYKRPDGIPRAQTPSQTIEIARAPTLHFPRATWWDYLTNTYTLPPTNASVLTPVSRHEAAREISRDVYGFFKTASVWLSFINTSLFFDTFHHTELRSAIQPSLVFSILAYSKLLQSDGDTKKTDPEKREKSWRQSIVLRDLAQASFEASYNAGWMDLPLAQAAWILVLYEISAHPNWTSYRMQSAMSLLDNVIRALGLTSLDTMDPHVPTFTPNAIPTFGRPSLNGARYQVAPFVRSPMLDHRPTPPPIPPSFNTALIKDPAKALPTPFHNLQSPVDQPYFQRRHGSGDVSTCPCQSLSLARSPEVLQCTPTWHSMPRWAPNATWADIRKEEGRRLIWSALVMLGQDAAVRQAAGMSQLDLYVSKPENFAVLFPGEEEYASIDTTYSGKESHWALWSRTMLLWFACIRHASHGGLHNPILGFSASSSGADEDEIGSTDAEFAMQVWTETVAIEDALNSHSCVTEQALVYQSREFLFIIRMQVSSGFRYPTHMSQTGINFMQLHRDSALKWIRHRYNIGMTLEAVFVGDVESPGRKWLMKLPFSVHLSLLAEWRALELWKLDNSLPLAVEVALKYQRIVDWFHQVWPCAETQRWATTTSSELKSICKILGKDVE
ncbi:hypothetical protein FRB95_006340 [Tulasnella sp. JGI-2019a]|nr:hypothetical protein FRB95_006340 [Tulasnella sp. JGI-2019a]